MINQNLKIDLIPGGGPKIIRVSQYDHDTRHIIISLKNNKVDYSVPDGVTVQVRGTKPSGKGFLYTCPVNDSTVTVIVKDQMTTESGLVRCELVLINGNAILGSGNFILDVEKASFDPGTVTSSDTFDSLVEDAVVKCANEKLIELYVDVELSETSESPVANKVVTAEFKNMRNNLVSAITGVLSGEVIRADDVSPFEHDPTISIRGKNYCKTNEISVSGSYPWVNKFLDEVITLKPGKYNLSADFVQTGTPTHVSFSVRDNASILKSLTSISSSEVSGTLSISFEIDTELDVKIVFYSNLTGNTIDSTCTFTNIQLEDGSAKTDFNSWLDPSTVTLTRCGKNILPIHLLPEQQINNGITVTRMGNVIKFDGTATADCVLFNTAFCKNGEVNNHYNLSVEFLAGNLNGTASVCVGASNSPTEARSSWGNVRLDALNTSYAYPLTKSYIKDLWFYCEAGTVFNQYSIQVQLEKGKEATDYEVFNGVEIVAPADGIISNIPSIAPTMTLLTDTKGIIIECKYTRDTNKVVDKLVNAITALGGTV